MKSIEASGTTSTALTPTHCTHCKLRLTPTRLKAMHWMTHTWSEAKLALPVREAKLAFPVSAVYGLYGLQQN